MASFKEVVRRSKMSSRQDWHLEDMLSAIYNRFFNDFLVEDLTADVLAILGVEIVVKEVLDLPHQSDEHCMILVATVNDEPVLIHKKVGDKGSYEDGVDFLDEPFSKKLIQALVQVKTERLMNELNRGSLIPENYGKSDDFLFEDMNYLQPLGASTFSLPQPKWLVSTRFVEDHPCYILSKNGEAVRLKDFLGWLNEGSPWSNEANLTQCEVQTACGETIVVDARNIIVSLSDDQDELAKVISDTQETDQWGFLPRGEGDLILSVWQHTQGNVFVEYECLSLKDEEASKKASLMFSGVIKGRFSEVGEEFKNLIHHPI